MADPPKPRIVLPSLAAGPLVILLLLANWYFGQIPNTVEVPLAQLPGMALFLLVVLPLSAGIGFLPAILCNSVCSLVLIWVGQIFPLLRFPFIWPLVGGLAAWWFAQWAGMPPEWEFAFTGAGAISALLCRIRLA